MMYEILKYIYSIIAIAAGIYAAESDMLLLMLHRSNGILIIDYDDGDDRPRTDSEQAPKTEQRLATAQVMSADADDAPRRQMRRSHTRKENTRKFLSVTRCVCVTVDSLKAKTERLRKSSNRALFA